MSDETLTLRILPSEAELPDDHRRMKVVEPARGGLSLEGGLSMALALPSASRAEQRWVVEKAVDKVTGAFPVERVRMEVGDGVDDDTALTLALDRHLGAGGGLELLGRPAVAERLRVAAPALDTYRAWVDEDATIRTSLAIARDVSEWGAGRDDVEVEVLDEEALESLGLRLLLTVGGASRISPPRLVLARYRPDDPRPPRMLVGKGITFDTGGINVKPYESFVSMMKNDMGGAALAWSLFRSLVEQGVDEPLALVLPTCENPVGEEAMRPGTVVRSYSGHRVRVDHTDAEGRLVLADGLAYATERFAPGQVITFATLTTAALIAYGPYATPVHFADPETEERLRRASDATGEDLHFFPARLWHREANRDEEADLRNTGRLPGNARRGAGSRNAAHFLAFFTDAPLVHLDIFASTWNWAGDAPGGGAGATGAPLRTLLRTFGEV
ncbi:MAG: M17 family metallopeptidase [Myxococcota bacterium]